MEGMNVSVFLSIAIPLSLYFLITLAGAFVKDMYNTIRGVDTTFVGAINTYEVLNHTKCIIVKDAVTKLEEVYA